MRGACHCSLAAIVLACCLSTTRQQEDASTAAHPVVRIKSSHASRGSAFPQEGEGRSGLHFLHIPRTGGASVEKVIGHRERGPRQYAQKMACSFWHTPPRDLEPSNLYLRKTTFCVVRDPLARALSEFKLWRAQRLARNESRVVAMDEMTSANAYLRHTFGPEAVTRGGASRGHGADCHLLPQSQYVWDAAGVRTCTHVLRFEVWGGRESLCACVWVQSAHESQPEAAAYSSASPQASMD